MHLAYLVWLVLRYWLRRHKLFKVITMGHIRRNPAIFYETLNTNGVVLGNFKAIFTVQPDWVLRVKSAIEKKGYSLGNWRLMVIEDTFKSQVLDAVSQVRSSERVAFREIDSLLVWVDDDIESNVID